MCFPACAAVSAVSVLDTDPGASTACGSDRTRNLSQPWVAATWTVTKGYDIRLAMDGLITAVDAYGRFTICLDALSSALASAEALGLKASLTLFPGMPQPVVDYGVAHGEPTYVYTDPNPRHPGYGIPVTRLAPWAPSAVRAQQEIYAAIRNLVVVQVPGQPSSCRTVNGNRVCTGGQLPVQVSRLTYFVHSPLPGMRYLRIIAGENDPTSVSGYSRATLEATVKAGYVAARGIAPLQVHEIYNVSDAQGDLSSLAVGWARDAGDVGIFIENLQPNYPTCSQGQGKIMCEAGLPVVFEMVSPLGATSVVSAINWGETLSPLVRDYRIYVDDANAFTGATAAAKAASAEIRNRLPVPAARRVAPARAPAAH
jgi:hypothetical protein